MKWSCRPRPWLMLLIVMCLFWGQDMLMTERAAGSERVLIDDVRVEGSQRIEKEAILAVIETKKGDVLDYDRLDKDLRNIFKMKYFTDVKTEITDGPGGKIVVFHVTEKPSIGKIVFNGNKKIKDEDLKKELGIKLYSIMDDLEIKQSINRLTEFYKKKAYYNVAIEATTESIPNNEVLLKYQIAEDEKVYITKIKFVGNKHFKDRALKKQMEISEKGFFSWITDSGHLDKKKLEYDIHRLTAFYNNNGFIKAKIGEPEIIFDKGKGLTIKIEIEEGDQYKVRNVAIEGDLIKPEEELLKKVNINKEEVFNRETVRNDMLALKNEYVDIGYAYAEVSPNTEQDDVNHIVDVIYIVSKGQKVRIGRINIIGNAVTRDKVIRRELKQIEGDYYNGEAIKKSKENLDRLGFFEEVDMQTKKGASDELMVMDVKVKERPTGSFSIGAGYSSQDDIFAMFQIAQNNLFGKGQKLQASAKLGGLSTEFNIGYTEPWLFDTRLSGTVNLYKWKQEYEDYTYEDVNYDQYTRDSSGVNLGLGYPIDKIDEYTRGSISYGYDNSDISNVPWNASAEWRDMEGKNVTSSMTFGIGRDSKDKPWDTSKGSENSISFEFAGRGLGGDVNFNKIRATSAWYFPLFWKTVFLVRGNWGFIEEMAGGKLPVYQKFRIGGINSVRGFDYASISPLDPITKERIGGERMMYYNVEYRFPLLKEQGIVGLVFYDAGNVFTDDQHYTFSGIRKSAGCGIRWYSPMGPLRIEYGKNLDQQEGESSGKWEFSVGGLY
jgi:outer membrane protein insertion porin family